MLLKLKHLWCEGVFEGGRGLTASKPKRMPRLGQGWAKRHKLLQILRWSEGSELHASCAFSVPPHARECNC
jgi:hypothetical protein